MDYFSYHTHSTYCDGHFPPEDFVLRAIELGMKTIGFSSHAPVSSEFSWSMPIGKLNAYEKEIRRLKEKYRSEIEVLLSLEMDYIPGITADFNLLKNKMNLDYTIGSVHLVKDESIKELWVLDGPETNYIRGIEVLFDGNVRKAVTAYYQQIIQMIQTQNPDVVGHIDKVKMNNQGRFFSEDEKWYKDLQNQTLEVLQHSDSIVEVNTRGIYKKKTKLFFPDGYFLLECKKRNIPITIGTDAHHPDELISEFDSAMILLKEIGFEFVRVFEGAKWVDKAL